MSTHQDTAHQQSQDGGALAPLVKTVTVPTTPDRAFRLFTAEMTQWWPLAHFSIGTDRARSVTFPEREGEQILEPGDDGVLGVWGTVTTWDPPSAVSFTWHRGTDADDATHVAVRFSPVADGTRVELTHDRWGSGTAAAERRGNYASGWDQVLGRFVAHVG